MSTLSKAIAADQSSPEDDQECPGVVRPMKSDSPWVHPLSSELDSSNGTSIYDATRASSNNDNETTTRGGSGNGMLERVDSKTAGNLAMFYDLRSDTTESAPCCPFCKTDPTNPPSASSPVYRFFGTATGSLPNSFIKTDLLGEDQVARLNKSLLLPWPTKVRSPVRPFSPSFPPPTRSPTPPGLPSFGSQEARSYDFRFEARPPNPARQESLLRRLFHRPSTVPSPTQRSRQTPPRVFAEDGTAVLGSFPQRQSGHGTNVLRGIDDHPFHQRNLSVAQCDGTNEERNVADFKAPDFTEQPPFLRAAGSNPEQLAGTCIGERVNCSPSVPQSAASPTLARDFTLPAPLIPITRPDTFHSCVSQVPEARAPNHVGRQSPMTSPESIDPTISFLSPTQTAVLTASQDTAGGNSDVNNQPSRLLQLIKRACCIICCCSVSKNDPDIPYSHTTTHETYVTARDQVSNQTEQSRPSATTGV